MDRNKMLFCRKIPENFALLHRNLDITRFCHGAFIRIHEYQENSRFKFIFLIIIDSP